MAGFPHPTPNCYRDGHGDVHSLTTPSLANPDPAHSNIYPCAHGNPLAVCYAITDTISHPACRGRSVGNNPPAGRL